MKVLQAIPALVLLAAGWTCAHATAHFVTIQRVQTNLGDTVPGQVSTFLLPTAVTQSTATAFSAVLDLAVFGSTYGYNEVYINPPTSVCTDNDADANQAASIGMLQKHEDSNLQNEWAENHIAFSSALLLPGVNRIMFCVRNSTGGLDGNLDNIGLKSIVLSYHAKD
jgi:hypothetical protein